MARIWGSLFVLLVALVAAWKGAAIAEEAPTGPSQTIRRTTSASRSEPAADRAERPVSLPPAPPADADEDSREEFVQRLLAEMTRSEKIGQMCQIFPPGPAPSIDFAQQIRAGEVGSIFYAGDEDLVRRLQEIAVRESRLGIPLLVARDVIHGFRTVVPIPLGQAATWNPELIEDGAAAAADEARRVGIHWTFAPMVDVARDPRWGRIAESLGEDPVLASALGAAMVRGFQKQGDLAEGVVACPKHFVAYGLAEGGRDYNSVMVSPSELQNVYLRPFHACVDAGALTLMSSFNTVNGVPATAHEGLLRGVLKDQWGFKGFVVSDWGSVAELIAHGYSADDRGAALAAATAGVDMDMSSSCFADHLANLIDDGEFDDERLDDAVGRILRVKVALGLFQQPYADSTKPELVSNDARRIAKQLAAESLVLLKNEKILPLATDKLHRVAVIGPLADSPVDQMGTWTLDGKTEDVVTPLAALKRTLGPGVEVVHVPCLGSKFDDDSKDLEVALAAARTADVALLFVGEEQNLSGEARSRATLDLPGGQRKLVEAIGALATPSVMVVLAGRPLAIGSECDAIDGVLYAWHPGTMGGPAIVDVLAGATEPTGRLPVTFPRSVGQVPTYYNHMSTGRPAPDDYHPPALAKLGEMQENERYKSHYVDADPSPLFPFGWGLSYTKFQYDGLELSTHKIAEGQTLAVRGRVSNVGDRAGVETVQLYVRDVAARVVRPVRELKAFRRIALKPGASEVVEFALAADDLAYFDEAGRRVVEPGEFQVWLGGDSTAEMTASFKLR